MRFQISVALGLALSIANASPIRVQGEPEKPAVATTEGSWHPPYTRFLLPYPTDAPPPVQTGEDETSRALLSRSMTSTTVVYPTPLLAGPEAEPADESVTEPEPTPSAKPSPPSVEMMLGPHHNKIGPWKDHFNGLDMTRHAEEQAATEGLQNGISTGPGPVIPYRAVFDQGVLEDLVHTSQEQDEDMRKITGLLAEHADEADAVAKHTLEAEQAIKTLARDYEHLREMVEGK